MGYTKEEIINKCQEALKDIKTFYKNSFINYLGNTVDTDEPYSEVVAEFVCDHVTMFLNDIPIITRKLSYKTLTHDGEYDSTTNRKEEVIAMQMFGNRYDFIGKIIDYQTPLKSSRSDVAGKIDLLAYDGSTLYILELKEPESTENMLRCVLEGFTYMQTFDKQKLLQDFDLPKETKIVTCPFVFKGRKQWGEMQANTFHLKKLMNLLNIRPYYISGSDGKFIVTEE